ncbi:MAG: LysR family transcriptional regulator [Oscillospiraceae bacterium]|nr:LysR family transcriptional regulator [Oscillospiraceae bacterium]
MNKKYLISFMTVVEEGSINMAASRLFISPSALMKQVNSVEEEVGATLLLRGKKGVELTEAGEIFHAGLKELLPAYEELIRKTKLAAQRAAKGILVGSWSVACHAVLPAILNYFQIRHPEVELVFRNISSIVDMPAALEKREIDVTFSFGGKSRMTSQLQYVTLAREEPLLLLPPNCEIPMQREYTLEDFENRALIVTDGSVSGWFDRFNRYVEERYPGIRLVPFTENEAGLMEMQKLGAPCVASRSIVPRDSRYVTAPLKLPEDFEDPLISIDLICRRENSPLKEQFLQSAAEAAKVIWFNS